MRIIYLDEAHFHQDLNLGYSWGLVGQPLWRESHSPPLSARLNWYGAYDFSQGRCLIWHYGKCNGEHTVKFLKRLADWLGADDRQTVIIWDGAPYHRAKIVQACAAQLGFILLPLPGYSPDLNPIEGLWKWMREDLTQHHCYKYLYQLERACFDFIDRINLDPTLRYGPRRRQAERSVRVNLLSLVEAHPEIRFDFFFPPYSILSFLADFRTWDGAFGVSFKGQTVPLTAGRCA